MDEYLQDLFQSIVNYAGEDYKPEQDEFLFGLVEDALEEVVNEMYPVGIESDETLLKVQKMAYRRYKHKIRRIAEYHYDKWGKEGIVNSTENGTQFTYEDAGTPKSYLRGIIPVSRII